MALHSGRAAGGDPPGSLLPWQPPSLPAREARGLLSQGSFQSRTPTAQTRMRVPEAV